MYHAIFYKDIKNKISLITKWQPEPQTLLIIVSCFVLVSVVGGYFLVNNISNIWQDRSIAPNFNVEEKYKADEFVDLTDWKNSQPIKLSDLKGKVVLVQFWNTACASCRTRLSLLNNLYKNYKNNNFVVIGINIAEFDFEDDQSQTDQAISELGLDFPTATDIEYKTWQKYDPNAEARTFLIDSKGYVRHVDIDTLPIADLEKNIRSLIRDSNSEIVLADNFFRSEDSKNFSVFSIFEFGNNYQDTFYQDGKLKLGESDYIYTQSLSGNEWGLDGKWRIKGDSIESLSDSSELYLRIDAVGESWIIAESPKDVEVEALIVKNPIDEAASLPNQTIINSAVIYKILTSDNSASDALRKIKVAL